MYDFVVILTFDEKTTLNILSLRKILQDKGNKFTEKLPPHITIDLYENVSSDEIVNLIDKFIKDIQAFKFQFTGLDDFENKVLFIRPNNLEKFERIKNLFDSYLENYRIKTNANQGTYKPHTTLLSEGDIQIAKEILNDKIALFDGEITQLCVFAKNKQLIKKYDLSSKL